MIDLSPDFEVKKVAPKVSLLFCSIKVNFKVHFTYKNLQVKYKFQFCCKSVPNFGFCFGTGPVVTNKTLTYDIFDLILSFSYSH